MQEGFLVSGRAIKDMAELKRRFLPRQTPMPGRNGRSGYVPIEWQGELTEAVTPATDPWTGATTSLVQLYEPDPESTSDPVEMIISPTFPDPIEVVNRDPSDALADLVAGTYCRVKEIDGEWMFTWIGCPP